MLTTIVGITLLGGSMLGLGFLLCLALLLVHSDEGVGG